MNDAIALIGLQKQREFIYCDCGNLLNTEEEIRIQICKECR